MCSGHFMHEICTSLEYTSPPHISIANYCTPFPPLPTFLWWVAPCVWCFLVLFGPQLYKAFEAYILLFRLLDTIWPLHVPHVAWTV